MKDWVIKYWAQVGFTTLISFVTYWSNHIHKKFKANNEEQAYIKEGLMALLHDRLYQACQFHLEHSYITVADLDNLEYLYNGYHELGGNGTGTELYNRCKALPLKKGVA